VKLELMPKLEKTWSVDQKKGGNAALAGCID
jgi:hypothetical protein